MKGIAVLGIGPAAVVIALLLQRMGFAVQVLGKPRRIPLLEGASPRVAQGLERAGCHYALEVLGRPWPRASSWNGEYHDANVEHVIDRSRFDSAFVDELETADVDFHDVMVLATDRVGDGMDIRTRMPDNTFRTFHADFVVDARGRSTSRVAPNLLAGPVSVALTRQYQSSVTGQQRTVTEAFEQGWAWSTCDRDGVCTLQCVVDPESLTRGVNLDALHGSFYRQLQIIPRELRQPTARGRTHVRGAQAVLRGGLVDERMLRVGDAAYSSDPLSGHGMYEAISGAFAAAPVVNTLLNDPAGRTLAMRFYEQRAALTFAQRSRAGTSCYQSEHRWADASFWALRRGWGEWQALLGNAHDDCLLQSVPVVLDGFIRAKTVVVSEQHPQGVRFLAGVELVQLIAGLCEGVPLEALPTRVNARRDQVAAAISWLCSLEQLSAPSFHAFVDRLRHAVDISRIQS